MGCQRMTNRISIGQGSWLGFFDPDGLETHQKRLFVNKRVWRAFNEQQMIQYEQDLFNHFRKYGFPHWDMTKVQRQRVIKNMLKFDTTELLVEDSILRQFMLGLDYVNSFMPHIWDTKCKNYKTPMECFNDDEMLKKAIKKRLKYGDNMSEAGMRKALSWTSGTHRVSNFKPTIAKYIYDNYSGDGKVLDSSSGYGGRLFGAFASKSVKSYVGTDPCEKTFNALETIKAHLLKSISKDITLHQKPFEILELEENSFDLSFTSPPYFDTEEYAYDENQSFVKFNTKAKWRDGFLKPMIQRNYRWVKEGGYFIINVANVKTYPDLENDVVALCKEAGFEYVKTYQMTLSGLLTGKKKFEPIFVFQKPQSH